MPPEASCAGVAFFARLKATISILCKRYGIWTMEQRPDLQALVVVQIAASRMGSRSVRTREIDMHEPHSLGETLDMDVLIGESLCGLGLWAWSLSANSFVSTVRDSVRRPSGAELMSTSLYPLGRRCAHLESMYWCSAPIARA